MHEFESIVELTAEEYFYFVVVTRWSIEEENQYSECNWLFEFIWSRFCK